MIDILPPFRGIVVPEEGLQERTYYVVDVSYESGNPVHRAIFYTGFFDSKGNPCGYSQLWSASYEYARDFCRGVYYMKVVKNLGKLEDTDYDI
jgi:hypothetical protein